MCPSPTWRSRLGRVLAPWRLRRWDDDWTIDERMFVHLLAGFPRGREREATRRALPFGSWARTLDGRVWIPCRTPLAGMCRSWERRRTQSSMACGWRLPLELK